MKQNMRSLLLALVAAGLAWGQLIPNGSAIPRRDKPPVVFLNGYQQICAFSSFSSTFGRADAILQANGQVSIFFNNCDVSNASNIEALGAAFGTFLAGLKYDNGQPVTAVDAVAHSLGGIILRSYLSGKRSDGTFRPPATVSIRKAVFLATPHFGTPVASSLGLSAQVDQISSGSKFLFDLDTWNQGTDDLRGVDALAIAGNAGLATVGTANFTDGVVPLTSASIGWTAAGRTRVLPLCHTSVTGLVALVCPLSAGPLANWQNAADSAARIVLSFLDGTNDWSSIGTAIEDDPLASKAGGLMLTAAAPDNAALAVDSATGGSQAMNVWGKAVAFFDQLAPGAQSIKLISGATTFTGSITVQKAAYTPRKLKTGPLVARVYPAASVMFPLVVAPGQFVAIYGEALSDATQTASGAAYPLQLGGSTVTVDGNAIPLYYVSPTQIDAVLPETASGLVKLAVRSGQASDSINVLVEPAVPAIFTQNKSGSGAASAQNASRLNTLITPSNPIRAGEYLSLYLTGLGATTRRDGLDWANQTPSVTIAGQPCVVSYAGRAPGFQGLDQINCVVPSGVGVSATAPVFVTSGRRSSNIATVAVE